MVWRRVHFALFGAASSDYSGAGFLRAFDGCPSPWISAQCNCGTALTAVMRCYQQGYGPEMPDGSAPPRDDAAERAAAPIVPDPGASGRRALVAEKPDFLVWAGLSLAATVVLSLLFSAAGNGATVIVFLVFLVGLPGAPRQAVAQGNARRPG